MPESTRFPASELLSSYLDLADCPVSCCAVCHYCDIIHLIYAENLQIAAVQGG